MAMVTTVRPAFSAGLFFFLGKKERLAIDIRKNEFALISSLMMEADREARIEAFGNALEQSKPGISSPFHYTPTATPKSLRLGRTGMDNDGQVTAGKAIYYKGCLDSCEQLRTT
ncbi:hypothetical protein M2418_002324 [Rhizobium sp. BIGb0125]|uniref:hypothetical protein n=1 Tax=Rhizobium sp. BIGb0125 TaxID=2940618 RepID=UPI00216840FA|nr:hypothetical protein [Rhizobium sp. BIGb0125]MCS4242798.1 hypothetical protein [Rhizobium sp. BIGb0125]